MAAARPEAGKKRGSVYVATRQFFFGIIKADISTSKKPAEYVKNQHRYELF